jgi:hypothetical protein
VVAGGSQPSKQAPTSFSGDALFWGISAIYEGLWGVVAMLVLTDTTPKGRGGGGIEITTKPLSSVGTGNMNSSALWADVKNRKNLA